ncbi:MAG: hypothetical protein Q9168_005013 [Polycauliona sp. 1 TL-2023]
MEMSPTDYNNDHAKFWKLYNEAIEYITAIHPSADDLNCLLAMVFGHRMLFSNEASTFNRLRRTDPDEEEQLEFAKATVLMLHAGRALVPYYLALQTLSLDTETWNGDEKDEAGIRGLRVSQALEQYDRDGEDLLFAEKMEMGFAELLGVLEALEMCEW